jgi:hypothetical protein
VSVCLSHNECYMGNELIYSLHGLLARLPTDDEPLPRVDGWAVERVYGGSNNRLFRAGPRKIWNRSRQMTC